MARNQHVPKEMMMWGMLGWEGLGHFAEAVTSASWIRPSPHGWESWKGGRGEGLGS